MSGPRSAVTASLGLVIAALPVFLTGALAVLIRGDLDFDEARLGLAVAAFFAAAVVAAVPGGRAVERVGWRAGLLAGATCSLLALIGVAAFATTWAHLLALLAFAGLGVALIDPAANLVLARGTPPRWQRPAFGIKEAAIPTATLLGGASVPLLGVTVGWRAAFLLGVPLAAALWAIGLFGPARTAPRPAAARSADGAPMRGVTLLAVAGALGVGAATSLGAFLVQTAVAAGFTPAAAGSLLAGGSAAGIAARILGGLAPERREGGALALVAAMFAVGSVGFAAIASGHALALVAGTVAAFAGGWGWTGLLYYAVVRARSDAPARATGVVLTGLAAGSGAGPLGFGVLAAATSLRTAWGAAAVLALVAAALTLAGRRRLAGAA